MSDRVLVELIEDVNTVDADGDEVPLWAAGQQVWLDPISARSFVETRKVATLVEEVVPAEEAGAKVEVVERKSEPKKAPVAGPVDPAGGV